MATTTDPNDSTKTQRTLVESVRNSIALLLVVIGFLWLNFHLYDEAEAQIKSDLCISAVALKSIYKVSPRDIKDARHPGIPQGAKYIRQLMETCDPRQTAFLFEKE